MMFPYAATCFSGRRMKEEKEEKYIGEVRGLRERATEGREEGLTLK